ncbi:unnamed protein product [Callosobruchus maculatus]|uniref:Protein MMS22-like n=1 Tax=Callosobruchus maculatus TaxID=64391 RepID=A0A653DIH8_CALMS|nr:unnamed protein product [Callosobruchus maculatus]
MLFNCQDLHENKHQLVRESLCKDSYDIVIENHTYHIPDIIEEIQIIRRVVISGWGILQNIAIYNIMPRHEEISKTRTMINQFFCSIIDCLDVVKCDKVKDRYRRKITDELTTFHNAIININKLKHDFVLKLVAVTNSNSESPIFQYFHTFLEIHHYILVTFYKCGERGQLFKNHLEKIMRNIIAIGRNKFKRNSDTIFVCDCMKELLITANSLCNDVYGAQEFWTIFNKLLQNEDPLYTLNLLKSIADLQLTNNRESQLSTLNIPNYELLHSKLKQVLVNVEYDTLANVLKTVYSLTNDKWAKDATIETYQILWDYYSKRLNVSSKNYESYNARAFFNLAEQILTSPQHCDESFEIFVGMLICHLRNNPSQWGKMKGRIYSQLGPNKIKEMNEIGFAHIMILFICLSSVHYEESQKKILNFLQFYSPDRNLSVLWNVYTAFVLKQVKEEHDLEDSHKPLLQMLQQSVCPNQKHFHLVKEFLVNFEHILSLSKSMHLKQWLLFDFWLNKYFQSCYYADLKMGLDVILQTVQKVGTPDNWSFWESTFKTNVYPMLMSLSNIKNPPPVIGTIAGRLALLSPQISKNIIEFFNGDPLPPAIILQFLSVLLDNNYLFTAHQEVLVVQSWFKICLLTLERTDLTEKVSRLDLFPRPLKSYLETSDDPVGGLIEYLGIGEVILKSESSNSQKLCDMTFGHASNWLHYFLTDPESEPVVLRIYTYMSLAFHYCGPWLYQKSKSTCPAVRLLQTLYFPNTFVVGKAPHSFILNAIKKSWALLFAALVKLNTDYDSFLDRTLKDMLVKYIPYFSTSDSPIISCLVEEKPCSSVILEKMYICYMKHPVKEADENILKVLRTLSEIISNTTSESLLQLITNKVVYGLFELVIFHNQRNNALNLIKVLTNSQLYPKVSAEFRKNVVLITEKHLAFNTANYFQLMYALARFVPGDIKNVMDNIRHQVKEVERKRGVGFDQNLRLQFEKLENILKEGI